MNKCGFPRIPTPTLRTVRQVDVCPDTTRGVEGLEGFATVLALECCFAK